MTQKQIIALSGLALALWLLLSGLWTAYSNHLADERQHARDDLAHVHEDERRDERLRILESITLSEHPEYTLLMFPPKEK